MKALSAIAVLVLCFSVNSYAASCEVIRAAFDVGSGTTKMKIYRYDKCESKIVKQLCEGNRKVSYKEDLKDSNTIKKATIEQGLNALLELKSIAQECGAQQYAGVATSAFRLAKNGEAAVKRLADSGISLSIISQQGEADLGFRGVMAKVDIPQDRNICVWDIGASSSQIICKIGGWALGNLASISFRDTIIKFKSASSGTDTSTPNPISQSEYRYALVATQREASKIDLSFTEKLKDSIVFGIGGVHYYAVSKELGQEEYTADQIQAFLSDKLGKTDEELGGGEYVDTSVSNLILVEGMMRNLNVSSVKALKVNLTEGLVSSELYWE